MRNHDTVEMEGEEWRPFPMAGCGDLVDQRYQVSSLGRVRRMTSTGEWRIKAQSQDPLGYWTIAVSIGAGRSRAFKAHRVIATAFHPNPDGFPVVHHKDANPSNNRAENLEWTTQKENIRLAMAVRGNWLLACPRRTVKIVRVDVETGERVKYDSIRAAADQLNAEIVAKGGVAKPYVAFAGNICAARRKGRVSYGYRWEAGETRGRPRKRWASLNSGKVIEGGLISKRPPTPRA